MSVCVCLLVSSYSQPSLLIIISNGFRVLLIELAKWSKWKVSIKYFKAHISQGAQGAHNIEPYIQSFFKTRRNTYLEIWKKNCLPLFVTKGNGLAISESYFAIRQDRNA